ncbi:PREDICTED: aspartic and glutamic acid-rich protein-like isoform X2 [Camelina sativa]|uniref:Aspartic and glutamic acid-rich protein-like isoform X2 n=1 Tax=Camelina sativa TaxID=90675 RepID=A0ABM0XY21_CAMSA|nr:PREDICTED: aspartic and glutamic acid-rich protein-like isoform X2 [Camelina sativa]
MDFHSLLRRDLQFLCKRNKIPANMTNLAMADALSALEIVEGLDEYMNQSEVSPTSVAKKPPNTATRTTRRKTTVKAEPQSSSLLVSRSTSKSLAGEMDQENVPQEPKTSTVKFEANVPKTPAARTTRKASAATSCAKKDELVQSVYSTRRSTRLLEKCMADLSLKTRETLDKPARNEDTEQKVSAQEKNPSGSEAEVIPGRDLSVSMEQVWENLKSDSDQVVGDLEVYVDIGDIAAMDANTETNKEEMSEARADDKESENSLVKVDKQEETLQVMCEKKNDSDQEIGDLGDIPVLDHANTETHNDDNESKNVLASNSSSVDPQETEQAIKENEFEPEKIDNFDVEAKEDKTEQAIQENECEPEKINNFDVEAKEDKTEQAIQENECEPEKINNFDVEAKEDKTEQANQENEFEPEKIYSFGVETKVDQTDSDAGDSKTEQAIQKNDAEPENINNFDEEDTMVNQTNSDAGDSETEPEDDSDVDSESTISEADSNQAVLGSDIADEEMTLSESEGSAASAPNSPPLLEKAEVKTTPLSPFAAGSISVQFPRPCKSTTPSKNSALKPVNVENKENIMELMMNVDHYENGEKKGEEAKKKKKVGIDEENLKDASMRQLKKMMKDLTIKNSNRTALQILPGNNQTAE